MEAASFLVHRDRLVADDGFTFFGCIGSDSRTLSLKSTIGDWIVLVGTVYLLCCLHYCLQSSRPGERGNLGAAQRGPICGAMHLRRFTCSFFYAVLLQDNYSNWGAFIFAGSIFTLCVVVPSVIARSAMI
jgi:hypothetical protein